MRKPFGRHAASPIKALSVSALSIGCLCALLSVSDATAKTHLQVSIPVNWIGLGVATMNQSVTVDGTSYALSGKAKATKLASVVTKSRADWNASGRISGTRAVPNAHAYTYKSRKKKGQFSMSFAGGAVRSINSSPAIKYKPDSVPVLPGHKKDVVDPVTALIFPVKNGASASGATVCNRTLPVFDGKARIDLVFRHKASKKRVAKGFNGVTHTCSVRYKPVSGVRLKSRTLNRMKQNRGVEVTMARVGKTNVFALYGFKVPTRQGTASGMATVFSANQ
ncbi:DUF3108 domain-containing protein [Ahrensia sp. R2A130]|uniref:DUF3108 domain-containing protein n=1 Tax=Ahrensia sp. R2A130 TaxID=744979 RepID=UPI0018DB0654|nr:DUF3108 domain-containing protein [Ahrensia sp. R2A130]